MTCHIQTGEGTVLLARISEFEFFLPTLPEISPDLATLRALKKTSGGLFHAGESSLEKPSTIARNLLIPQQLMTTHCRSDRYGTIPAVSPVKSDICSQMRGWGRRNRHAKSFPRLLRYDSPGNNLKNVDRFVTHY